MPAHLAHAVSPLEDRAPSADEERLVVFCCALSSGAALDLIDQVAPERVEALREQAAHLLRFERRERVAAFTRRFAPPPAAQTIRHLAQRLDGEPTWFASAVCQGVAPEVRDRLLTVPSIRQAWRQGADVHPALANHASRLAARFLNG